MKFPDMDQKSFIASPALGKSREVILQENQGDFLLELDAGRIEVDVLRS